MKETNKIPDCIISVRNLTKNYSKTKAVDNISFDIRRGELISILGPNGAGKTTALECIEGLLSPDSGLINNYGSKNTDHSLPYTGGAGIQLQNSALPEDLTVKELMSLFCAYRKIGQRNDLLFRFGLEEKLNTEYRKLSTGQKRRLSLALSISHNPEVLFLDEPTAGLDVTSRVELHSIIRELRAAGTTIILATHDMAEAEKLSDRIVILLKGRIAAVGTPEEITSRGDFSSRISVKTENLSVSKFSGDLPAVAGRTTQDGRVVFFSTNAAATATAILKLIEKNNDKLFDLRIERPSLEEKFIEITGVSK